MKLGVSSFGASSKGISAELWPSDDDDDDDDDGDNDIHKSKFHEQTTINPAEKLRNKQIGNRVKSRHVDVSIEISELRAQAIAALGASHGDLADYYSENVLKEVVDQNRSIVNEIQKKPIRSKSNSELRHENEKLRKLLEESINDLPPVPTQESVLAQKRHQKEIESLNMYVKKAGKEERESNIEIQALNMEIQKLKETMKRKKSGRNLP